MNRRPEMIPPLFHTASPIQPPPLRGTSFHRKEGVSTRAPSLGRGCRAQRGGVGFFLGRRSRLLFAFPIGKGVVSRKAVSSYRSLPHRGRGTASAVDRVLSQTAYLRRFLFHLYHLLETIFFALFHPASTLSGSLRSPPSPRGEGFVRPYCFSTHACIRSDDMGIAVLSYRSLPHLERRCRRKRYPRFFIRPTQKRPSLTSGRFYVYYLLRKTLIKSQNSISHVFSCNASSYSSLNSSLFASKYSLHCMKI